MKIRNDLLLAAAILLISGCLSAQLQASDTPAAHQLSNWLTAFNSGDRATFLAFLQGKRDFSPTTAVMCEATHRFL
jgi:hypothetical protein